MKKTLFIIIIAVSLVYGNTVFAQEPEGREIALATEAEDSNQEETYVYPDIKPEMHVFGGYRFVSLNGSTRAEEYEFLHSSATLGGELRIFSFPHRFHLEADAKNRKDYFGDIGYAYEDIVLFRGINRTLYHNLDNVTLSGISIPSLGVDSRDSGYQYGVKFGMSSVNLRLKTPDFPFHVYLDGTRIERDGNQQLRSLLGSGYFNNIVRTSQERKIDWSTTNIIIGTNSHVGPVEIDISHAEKRFKANGNNVFYDFFSASSSTPVRPAGVYPHALIPDLKGSSNTLKLHTSYTGGLVASATFSKIDRENRDSRAKADYFIGAGELIWMPVTKLTFFLKYRHKEVDIENPEFVTLTDRLDPLNNHTYSVRPSISSTTDLITTTVRYRPMTGLTLRGEYSYEDIRRDETETWNISSATQRNIGSLGADIRLIRNLNIKAKYTHKHINGPAYNTEPDRSDEGKISVSWIPLPKINTLVSYSMLREERDDLHFDETQNAKNREVKKDRLLGSVTFLVLHNLSATASYSYMNNRVRQDIAYGEDSALTDYAVPQKDTVHNYSFDLNFVPKNNISLNAGVNYTMSNGSFSPSSADLLINDPLFPSLTSVASFSKLKTRETTLSASGEYRLKGGFTAGLKYKYSEFNDVLDNTYDDINDGKTHIVLLTLSKRW